MRFIILPLMLFFLFHGNAFSGGDGTSKLERFHLKRQNCEWTDEMGKYIYKCIIANNGFNAHWCHNEMMALYCDVENTSQ